MSKMDKNKWYVYIDTAHEGPFDWDEVLNLHAQNKIDEQSLVWREGQADWLPLCELEPSLKLNIPDIPPELPAHLYGEINANASEEEAIVPSIPFEDEVDDALNALVPGGIIDKEEEEFLEKWENDEGHITDDLENIQIVPTFEEKQKPSLPVATESVVEDVIANDEIAAKAQEIFEKKIENGVLEHKEVAPDIEEQVDPKEFVVEEIPDFTEFEVKENLNWGKLKVGLSVVFAIFIIISLTKVFSDKKMIPSLKALKVAESRRLMRAVNSKEAIRVAVSPSEDGREIWFSSNKKGPGIFRVKLNSVKDRVMTNKEVEVVGKTTFNNYVGVFRFLKLKKGIKIAPGDYKLTGEMSLTGRKARLYKYLKESSLFSNFDFVKNSKITYTINKDIRISKFQGEQFELKLKEFHDSKKVNLLRPLMTRLEKFRTMITLAENIMEAFEQELKKVRKGKDIRTFEVRYSKEMAPVLQGLILENHKISVSLLNKDSEASADYANLLSFGRQLGGIVSDMVTEIESKPKVRKITRMKLREKFSKEINKLVSHGREYTKSITKRIEKIQ